MKHILMQFTRLVHLQNSCDFLPCGGLSNCNSCAIYKIVVQNKLSVQIGENLWTMFDLSYDLYLGSYFYCVAQWVAQFFQINDRVTYLSDVHEVL